MWERMGQLFGHKWSSQEGEITDPAGKFNPRFLLWCLKTAHLTDEDWARGFREVEFRVREAARMGDEIWAPSYAAFLGYCEKPVGAPAHRYFDRSAALEDKTAKERRRQLGLENCSKLLGMFDNGSEE